MGYRHDRALGSPPSSNAPIQGREIVILHHRTGPGRLRQATPERDIALAHLATQPLPSALKTPRTQTSPRSQVPGRRKLVHIQSDLRQQSPGGHSVDSGNGAQPNDLILKREHALIDLLLDLAPFRFREAQVLEELSEQESMMLGHTTFERQFQFRDLVPQQPFGHIRQPGRVLLPGEHRLQDRSARSAQSIGRYRCQLNVGILQHLLNAIRNPVDLLYQTHAIPREVAKFTGGLRRHETPAEQSVLQQVRDPLAVFLVRLPTGHGFNVLRIHQQHLEPLRKNVPHRLPVHPGGLHGHMGYAALLEPIGQLQQIVSECPEALLLFTALPLGLSPQHTGGNTLLMHVQTTTAGIDNFHRATPFTARRRTLRKSENLLRVLSATSGGYNSLCFSASQPYSYENTFRRSEQAAPRSLCGP